MAEAGDQSIQPKTKGVKSDVDQGANSGRSNGPGPKEHVRQTSLPTAVDAKPVIDPKAAGQSAAK